ncbi:MAG: helix-turn-helix transcriptional regulator [Acidimicrobiales bacterium]
MIESSTRLLRLLAVLQSRPWWVGRELAERIGVTPRTVRRDVAKLRELGYAVDAVSGSTGGYRLRAGSSIPPLMLEGDEATAIALSLRLATAHRGTELEASASSALAKLERLLAPGLGRQVTALREATVTLPDAAPTVSPEMLARLAEVCRAGHRVTFEHRSRTGEVTLRHIDPYRLVHSGRHWYVVAFDRDRDDWRTFRADRIDDLRSAQIPYVPRSAPEVEAFVARSVAVAPYHWQARVRIAAPIAVVAEQVRTDSGVLESAGAEACILTVGSNSLDQIVAHVAALGHEFAILDPPELVDAARRMADLLFRSTDPGH